MDEFARLNETLDRFVADSLALNLPRTPSTSPLTAKPPARSLKGFWGF